VTIGRASNPCRPVKKNKRKYAPQRISEGAHGICERCMHLIKRAQKIPASLTKNFCTSQRKVQIEGMKIALDRALCMARRAAANAGLERKILYVFEQQTTQ